MQPVVDLVPQVNFRKRGTNEWTSFSEDGLSDPRVVESYGKKDSNIQIRILGPDEESRNRVIRRLAEIGIPFKEEREIDEPFNPQGEIPVEVATTIDQTIRRCVAKICFNYLAHRMKAAFALQSDFDAIRDYIRNGQEPSWRPVTFSGRPILKDDSESLRQTNGHLITLNWDRTGHRAVAQLSFFNDLTYRVELCTKCSEVWTPIESGHHFDIETMTVNRLASASGLVVPYYKPF